MSLDSSGYRLFRSYSVILFFRERCASPASFRWALGAGAGCLIVVIGVMGLCVSIPSIPLILAAMSLMMSGKSMFRDIGCSARRCDDDGGGVGKIG